MTKKIEHDWTKCAEARRAAEDNGDFEPLIALLGDYALPEDILELAAQRLRDVFVRKRGPKPTAKASLEVARAHVGYAWLQVMFDRPTKHREAYRLLAEIEGVSERTMKDRCEAEFTAVGFEHNFFDEYLLPMAILDEVDTGIIPRDEARRLLPEIAGRFSEK